ncbi:RNA polymerase sigma-B factor [Propionibacteriaceae bacterium ES.041]|nr:RNA polymerase sigma-B factor [Propionibacteriaceae bacterium ES.041]TDO91546.1 RNA polymerase sigma-B factor [Enemella evansiae]
MLRFGNTRYGWASVKGMIMAPHRFGTGLRNPLNDTIETLLCAEPGDEVLGGAPSPQEAAIVAGLPLAESIARSYRGRGADSDDLLQVARLGLVKAVQGYRLGSAAGFVAYAVPTIKGEIKRHFRDHEWLVRPPRALQELQSEVSQTRTALGQRLGRNATDDEVAEALSVSADRVRAAGLSRRAYAAAQTGPDDLVQIAAGGDDFARVLDRESLQVALAGLTDRDAALFRMRFVEERSQSAIGQELGVSQVQVSRLLARLIDRLRAVLVDTDQLRAS